MFGDEDWRQLLLRCNLENTTQNVNFDWPFRPFRAENISEILCKNIIYTLTYIECIAAISLIRMRFLVSNVSSLTAQYS